MAPAYPLAMEPRDNLFRKMLALSGVFHVLAFFAGIAWLSLNTSPLRVAPVTVVDLIGEGRLPAVKESAPSPPAAAPSRPQKSAGKKDLPPKAAKREKKSARPEPPPPREAPAARRDFSETIRKLRQEKASDSRVRDAVETMQREKAVRAAIKGIGDRVAHRVDLSAVRTAAKAPAPKVPVGLPGASGTTRAAPEILAYARALDEKVRANWTVPELAEREAKKLMVQVRITIEKDGSVSHVRMEKISGNPYFDDSVERAIRKASPLPTPPEQLRGKEDHYEVGFRFYGGAEQ